MLKHRSSLAIMAALTLTLAAAASVPGPSGVTRASAKPRRRLPTAIDSAAIDSAASELQREIAAWNAAVERRKAEKRRLRGA